AQIGLPFLPIYTDLQFKFNIEPTQKDRISIVGIGAIDDFALNLDANETPSQRYILNYLPVNEQYNYTRGLKYTRFHENSYTNLIFSRNKLNNRSFKYENNDDSNEDNKILDYISQEVENRIRIENVMQKNGFKLTTGLSYEYDVYTNETYNRLSTRGGVITIDFDSRLDLHQYGAFAQLSKKVLDNRLLLSLGTRIDGSNYSEQTNNPLEQFAPRFSASYAVTKNFRINFNTGQYFQLPPYTILGYRNAENQLVNKQNEITYIRNRHLVSGVEFTTKTNTRFSIEGFYKKYDNYPFLLNDSVSLANLGSDFGVVGNEPANSTSEGRSFGLEFLIQQKLYKGFYGIMSYTILKSEFTDKSGDYKPSAWDNRHFLSLTAGKKFKKNWEVGARWWFVTGGPYTPFDLERSATKAVWDVTGRGLPNYDRINERRLSNFNQLDLRVDKKYYFDKWSLNVYFDIQNVYGSSQAGQPFVDVVRDDLGNPVSANQFQYQLTTLENNLGTTIPSIGIIAEF
ncbi:MAG: TonB-dependent receptor, partial [Bacteroidetes bacterium]|nr:TonB-dependent receptor [Bacteroidota bacterium]